MIKKTIQNFTERFRRLLTQPKNELTNVQKTARFWYDLAGHCSNNLRRDNATQMAAALTYRTLFSIMPMIVLALAVLSGFKGLEEYQERFKTSAVQFLVPKATLTNRHIDTLATTKPATKLDTKDTKDTKLKTSPNIKRDAAQNTNIDKRLNTEQAAKQITASSTTNNATNNALNDNADTQNKIDTTQETRTQLTERIGQLLDQLSQVNFKSIGGVGLLLFIYGATTLLATVETSFNAVFHVTRGRPWYLRIIYYYTVVTLGPILIVSGQLAQQSFTSIIETGTWTQWLAGPLAVLSPLISTWLVLLTMFILLPCTKVRLSTAAIGSILAALAWVVSKEVFAIYVSHKAASSIYGALGLIPLFLLWIYITWLVTLFGLELAYTLQTMGDDQHLELLPDASPHICSPSDIIPVMALLGHAFETGNRLSISQITQSLQLPDVPVQEFTKALAKHGLLHHLGEHDDEQNQYTLAKPANKISLDELLNIAQALTLNQTANQANMPTHTFIEELQQAQKQTIGNRTLADIL